MKLLVYIGPTGENERNLTRAKFVGTLHFDGVPLSAQFQYSEDWIWGIEHEPHNFFAIDPQLESVRGAWQPIDLFGFMTDAQPWFVDYKQFAFLWSHGRNWNVPARKLLTPSLDRWAGLVAQIADEVRFGAFSFVESGSGKNLSFANYHIPTLLQLPRANRDFSHVFGHGRPNRANPIRLPEQPIKPPWYAIATLPGYELNATIACRESSGRIITCILPFGQPGSENTSWAAAQLAMAKNAGITSAFIGTTNAKGKPPTLMFERFDRDYNFKVPVMSAATIMKSHPGDKASFFSLAEIIRSRREYSTVDLEQLWRRAVFGCLADFLSTTSTVGFLWRGNRWRLAPMWHAERPGKGPRIVDNHDNASRKTAPNTRSQTLAVPLAIGPEIRPPCIEDALSVSETFGLDRISAERIAGEIGVQVTAWRKQALIYGVQPTEIERVGASFPTSDLKLACSFATPAARIRQRGMGRG